jgi:hypothetical protein
MRVGAVGKVWIDDSRRPHRYQVEEDLRRLIRSVANAMRRWHEGASGLLDALFDYTRQTDAAVQRRVNAVRALLHAAKRLADDYVAKRGQEPR